MPGPKTLKRINDYFAACQELLTTCTENVDELREKLREQGEKLCAHKNAGQVIGDMVETYQQLLCGDLIIKQCENDFLEGRL